MFETDSHTSEELYDTIETQKAQIPSLINGGFTNAVDNSSPDNSIEFTKIPNTSTPKAIL